MIYMTDILKKIWGNLCKQRDEAVFDGCDVGLVRLFGLMDWMKLEKFILEIMDAVSSIKKAKPLQLLSVCSFRQQQMLVCLQ